MNLLNKKDYRPGDANFESHFLDFSRNIIQVKPTKKLLFFYGIFALIGFITTYAAYPIIDRYMIAPYANENVEAVEEESVTE